MKGTMKLVFSLLSFFFALHLQAQKEYFQQEVNYKIKVQLDDQAHMLNGYIEIEYINNAPETLDFLYFHLWPNAFKDQSSAFAKQQRIFGSNKFFFADEEDRGYIDQLNFTINETAVKWDFYDENPDIAKVILNQPLASGEKLTIQTPFRVKIPASFSRLGHEGQSYQITQWYPKPAVYDRDGWHPMPYLDMGEFYSEFGNYEVAITLPENYVVGATGQLQEVAEQQFLARKVEKTKEFLSNLDSTEINESNENIPLSSTRPKTISYRAEKIHDFAWFADKRFMVQKSAVTLASGKVVDTWTMFTKFEADLWKKSINYIDEAVRFMSEQVGEYPWPQATAVQAALSAGGGMEYPMITVIDEVGNARTLDELILHEVGHNWFYGILANNERTHPWMDEGINTFYEQRYNEEKYGSQNFNFLPDFVYGDSKIDFLELSYLYQARRNQDQAAATTSEELSRINYFLSSYEKPVRALRHLEAYLGRATFDRLMQGYYQEWKFKHPRPEDFRAYLENNSTKDLSWLFDDYLYASKKLDYQLKGVKNREEILLDVKNAGSIVAPFPIHALKNGTVVQSQWYEGFEGKKRLTFPQGVYDAFEIDRDRVTMDIYRKNNLSNKLKRSLALKLLPTVEDDNRSIIHWLPAVMWNNYDKLSVGLLLYNTVVPSKKFQFYAAPFFGFGSSNLTGLANFEYNFFPTKGKSTGLTIGVNARSATFNENTSANYDLQYAKITPFLKYQLPSRFSKNYHHFLQWRTIILNAESAQFDADGFQGKEWQGNTIHELSYQGESRRSLHPYTIKAALEQQSYKDAFDNNQQYLKLSIDWQPKLTYSDNKHFNIRAFAGVFLSNSKRNGGGIFPGAFNMTTQGFYDYRFDGAFLGRSEGNGIWSQQVAIQDGGFKNTIGTGFALGRTNDFLVAFNANVDLPFDLPLNLPLKPYFDIGYYNDARPTRGVITLQDQLMWSGGFMLNWMDGLLAIYFPVASSRNIQDRYVERGNYGTRISFSIDINKANPYYHINRIEF